MTDVIGNSDRRKATSELFELYGDEIFQYVRFSLGNQVEAEDLVQEIFLRVLKSWDRFQNRSTARTWLWSIARNCVKESFRKNKMKRNHQINNSAEYNHSVPFNDPSLRIDLENCLQFLSFSQRQVVIMRVIQERSIEETASNLGWTQARVRVTFHRALKKIQKMFAPDDLFSITREEGELHGC